MYPEINELMQRVYGESITVEELKGMALGQEGSGELKAMVNKATELEQYRWIHKQYFGTEAAPEDYAKYAGYVSPAELQWEILTDEKIKDMAPDINEAFTKVYGYSLTDEQMRTMLGEQQGYGELSGQYRRAKEEWAKKEASRGQSQSADIGYKTAPAGGFMTSSPGMADLG
jgi:hypothetical protein